MNRPIAHTTLPKSRGSWKLISLFAKRVAPDGTVTQAIPSVLDNEVYVTFQVTEPLLMSPFVFGSGYGKQGFYGIQTMNFQMNITPTANRAWRSAIASTTFAKTVVVDSFGDSTPLFQFLTTHPSELLEPRNTVPYYELPIYRTTNFGTLPGRANRGQMNDNGTFTEPAALTLNSSSVQLSAVPDKLIVFVRQPIANTPNKVGDAYATINKISITWNNQAGLLSSMEPQQLYRNSIQSGLAGLTWDQFSGIVVGPHSRPGQAFHNSLLTPYSGVGANMAGGTGNPGFRYYSTTGTILVLNFAEVIQLTDEFYAPGSLGSFNLQVSVTVQNNTNNDWPLNSYELVIMPMNCGVFVNEKGTSSTFTALLTKQDVLDANNQEAYSHGEVHRMVGGSFLDNLRGSLGWIHSKLPMVKHVLNTSPMHMRRLAPRCWMP
jgi:hypothetical protein